MKPDTQIRAEDVPIRDMDGGDFLVEPELSQHHQGEASILTRVWAGRDFVFRATYLGLLVSTVIAFWLTPRYVSTVRIMPPEKQSLSTLAALVGGADDKLSAIASDAVGLKTSGALFVGMLGSRTVQDRLVVRYDLRNVYDASLMVSARERLAGNTDVSEDRKSGIISVSVTDESPFRARDLAAAYVEELDRLTAEVSVSAARRERQFLETRLAAVRTELDRSAVELSEFSSRNVTFDPKEQGKAGFEAAARLQGELIAAQAQLSGLEEIYSAQNVRVRAVRAKIDELRRQLKSFATQGEGNAAFPSLGNLPGLGVRYYNLYRDVAVQEAVLEVLTKQYELAKVQEAKEIPTIKVLDEAVVPETKASPQRLNLILLGCLLSAMLSAAFLLIADAWQGLGARHPAQLMAADIENGLVSASERVLAFVNRIYPRFSRRSTRSEE